MFRGVYFSTIPISAWNEPSVHESRAIKPEVFKSKKLSPGHTCTVGDQIRDMIQRVAGNQFGTGIWENGCQVGRGEDPIDFLQQWVLLHVTSSEGPTQDGDLNQPKKVDGVIKSAHVLRITSRFVAIIIRAVEVEVSS